MKVEELMTRDAERCGPRDALDEAAERMWRHDCGFLPVVDGGRLVGVLTDRDVCLFGRAGGRRLAQPKVGDAMTRRARTCSPQDTLAQALGQMREHRVRRLPVADAADRLVGVLSLDDLAREAARGPGAAVDAEDVVTALAAICETSYPLAPEAVVVDVPLAQRRRPRTPDEALAARQADLEC